MKNVTFDPSFKRAYKALLRKRSDLKPRACTVEYDCRIVFDFVKFSNDGEEEILLIDIGRHDEVC